jgi:hypothetical protein
VAAVAHCGQIGDRFDRNHLSSIVFNLNFTTGTVALLL